MNSVKISPLKQPITAEVLLPGSLSYTIRALNIAALTKGTVNIINPLKSDDTRAMLNVLKELGIKVEEDVKSFVVVGDIEDVKNDQHILNIGISGRTARTILALLCIVPGEKILTCDYAFKKRPVKDLVDGLRQLGAQIEYLESEGCLPVKITSESLHPGTIRIPGNISSQYVSAIMMIAPFVGEIAIDVIGDQTSKPFIDITIDIMKAFGVNVTNENYKKFIIRENNKYVSQVNYMVEPDAISSSYFWGIAALTKSKIKVLHLSPNSSQGDIRFADILEKMGCKIDKNIEERSITIEGTDELRGIKVDMSDNPDVVQTLAVVAAFAKGTTHINGISHLRVKETDRIEAPKKELIKMGVRIEATENSLTIEGGNPHGAAIETYGDHRMAMAFAVAGSKIDGIEINSPEVINKSFREFWKELNKLGISIKKV